MVQWPETRRLTHNKVDVLGVRMPLKLERELVQVPYADLRFVCSRRDGMVPVSGGLDFVAGFGEVEVLDEFN